MKNDDEDRGRNPSPVPEGIPKVPRHSGRGAGKDRILEPQEHRNSEAERAVQDAQAVLCAFGKKRDGESTYKSDPLTITEGTAGYPGETLDVRIRMDAGWTCVLEYEKKEKKTAVFKHGHWVSHLQNVARDARAKIDETKAKQEQERRESERQEHERRFGPIDDSGLFRPAAERAEEMRLAANAIMDAHSQLVHHAESASHYHDQERRMKFWRHRDASGIAITVDRLEPKDADENTFYSEACVFVAATDQPSAPEVFIRDPQWEELMEAQAGQTA